MKDARVQYVIGDIHGEARLLDLTIEAAIMDAQARGRSPRFTFLGDLIDRGPDSMQCVETVSKVLNLFPGSRLHLGNHDQFFLEAMDENGSFMNAVNWLKCGGQSTLASYGAEDLEEMRYVVLEHYPHHLEMMKNASILTEDGPFIFVHAGIRPGIPLSEQDPEDLLWIRHPFLRSRDQFPRPVVHGHSINTNRKPWVTENRIGIDTGACICGLLTTLVIDPIERSLEFRQTVSGQVIPVDPFVLNLGSGTILDRLPELFDESISPTATAK